MKDYSGLIENAMRHLGLTRGARRVYYALAKAEQAGKQLSLSQLAEETGCCRMTIAYSLKRLEEHGLISRCRIRNTRGDFAVTAYTLIEAA